MSDFWHDTDPVTGFTHAELNGRRIDYSRSDFEKWFTGLNEDFPMDQLSMLHGKYFYTITEELYKLYVENNALREAIKTGLSVFRQTGDISAIEALLDKGEL